MPVDLGREIGYYRNQPGHNWLADALRKLQDHANTTEADLRKQLNQTQQALAQLQKK